MVNYSRKRSMGRQTVVPDTHEKWGLKCMVIRETTRGTIGHSSRENDSDVNDDSNKRNNNNDRL